MNILKRELRAGLKTFLFWTIALGVIMLAGMTKYTGIQPTEGAGIKDLIEVFPRVVLAVLGMANIDVTTLGGYYSVLAFYALLCAVIYAVHLGVNAVSREAYDKTYEFVFTKPRTRMYILGMKLVSMWLFLLVFCVFVYVFSVAAMAILNIKEQFTTEIFLFALSAFLVGSVFLALSAFVSAASERPDRGAMYGNCIIMVVFILGIIYDMLENGGALRFFTPLKYFIPEDLLNKSPDPVYIVISAALIIIFLFGAFTLFKKKDLKPA